MTSFELWWSEATRQVVASLERVFAAHGLHLGADGLRRLGKACLDSGSAKRAGWAIGSFQVVDMIFHL